MDSIFIGSTPIANSTEETQKSATPAVANSAEPATSVGTITTTTESAIAKNDERATISTLSASSPVPDALGTFDNHIQMGRTV